MTLVTVSITLPVPFPPEFRAFVDFEMVIVIPSLASAASLVRMRSRELSLQRSDGVREENKELKKEGMD
jgi:hypothetical protein